MYTEEELEDFAKWCILKGFRLGYIAGTWTDKNGKSFQMSDIVKMWEKDTEK